ncbi:hypothetical protein BGZ46_007943 [Entomortierella lignicola]|nr:hypothetical protein BGZ46_007943 [Entomortierella lignicola]
MAISRAMRQIILIGVICFGTIGMFDAMSSIGNAGQHSPTAQNLAITSSSIAYIVGFILAGGTHSIIGPTLCVILGGISFILYAASMMLAENNDLSVYPPLAGILVGLGAGLIWVTQGAMMMSYPTEDNKGKYISCFWAIFNLGAVLGSLLTFLMNRSPDMDPDDVSTSTYIVYMTIMGVATFLGVFLARPSTIVRDDGEPVIVAKFSGLKAEALAILSVFCDWRMLLLIPAFFFSNFSYTYQFNDFNGLTFTIRTRSLNALTFWIAQIIGALVIGFLLDRTPVKRPQRAMIGLLFITALFMTTWVAALIVQLKHKWERRAIMHKNDLIDYEHTGSYPGLAVIYAMFGFCDAAFAVFCYWLMGALSNKHDELSRYAGFFKSIQSLGSAVAAPLDLARTPFLAYLVTNWILCAISIAAMFVVCRTITDTTIEYEDNEEEEDYDVEVDDSESYDASTAEQSEDGQVHEAKKQASSVKGDLSTIYTTSEAGITSYDLQSRGHVSNCWRSSKTASGIQKGYIREQEGKQKQKRSSDDYLEPGDRTSYNPSTISNTTYPSRTYQSQYQSHSEYSFNHLGDMPQMTEISHGSSAGLESDYWVEYPLPAATAMQRTFYPQSQSSTLLPMPGTHVISTQPGSSTGTSYVMSAPTFMISDESSPPVPLYASQPEHFYHSQWLAEDQDLVTNTEIQEEEEITQEPNILPFTPEFLQMHNTFHPAIHAAGTAGSSTYDDEQEMDMDSIDVHSVSSMSSGHDSIPEMTEMSDAS